jgi:hypothetical protein
MNLCTPNSHVLLPSSIKSEHTLIIVALSSSVKFIDGVDHGDKIGYRGIRQHIMNCVEHKTSIRRQRPHNGLRPLRAPLPASRTVRFFAYQPHHPRTRVDRHKRAFKILGSMPAAEHCTGLIMSNPDSINNGMNFSTAPQQCLNVFQEVWR